MFLGAGILLIHPPWASWYFYDSELPRLPLARIGSDHVVIFRALGLSRPFFGVQAEIQDNLQRGRGRNSGGWHREINTVGKACPLLRACPLWGHQLAAREVTVRGRGPAGKRCLSRNRKQATHSVSHKDLPELYAEHGTQTHHLSP